MGYTTSWLANTFGTNAAHVGNCARSMWVDPAGMIYTASMWDENDGGIGIYQNGAKLGSIGSHNEVQGGAIVGATVNGAAVIYTPLQMKTTGKSGVVARYSRVTKVRDQLIQASDTINEGKADVITGLAFFGHYLWISDFPGNRVRKYNVATDAFELDISIAGPGALAADRDGNICVALKGAGVVMRYTPAGILMDSISLGLSARPSALFFDTVTRNLWIGDSGPDQNIKVYSLLTGSPVFVSTYGVQGGYLNNDTGVIKGSVGPMRFTRVVGIGKDSSGNTYVLNNPWGGTWDLGRDGGTDIHSYDAAGSPRFMLQSLNFEGIASADPYSDGQMFYSGTNVYVASAQGGGIFAANTVDPFTYPNDQRINFALGSRGEHFGMVAAVNNGQRILVACGQNPDSFEFYTFKEGFIAAPVGTLPGTLLPGAGTARVRNGFCLASNGDVWAGLDKTGVISHWPLTGFDASGNPVYGAKVTCPIPQTLGTLGRIIYLPETDTMILSNFIGTDWTSIGSRVEVYHEWMAGNRVPVVIGLTSLNPKSMSASGNHLFVGYVHTVPDVDAFDLTTGAKVATFTSTDGVYVGNDVDSMYGIRSMLRVNGEYVVTKDNYNGASVVVYRWTPDAT